MPDRQNKNGILFHFFINKHKLKQLYELYSLKFPEHGRVWRLLIKAKDAQIKILADFNQRFNGGDAFFKISFQAERVIGYVGDFIDRQFVNVRLDRVALKEALGVALSLEQSVMENRPFEIARPLNSDLEFYFNRAIRQSDRQLEVLNKAFSRTVA